MLGFYGQKEAIFQKLPKQEVPDIEETIIWSSYLYKFTSQHFYNIFHIIYILYQVDVLTQLSRPLKVTAYNSFFCLYRGGLCIDKSDLFF